MRRFMRNSVFAFVFALAFLFVGVNVSAKEEPAFNNTSVISSAATFNVNEQKFYLIDGNAQDAKITLKASKLGEMGRYGLTYQMLYYNAKVTVFRCSDYNAEGKVCNTWQIFRYGSDDNDVMDELKGKGLTVTFKNSNFTPVKSAGKINGFDLSNTGSEYDMLKTYFVSVQYKLQNGKTYSPDVLRVVLAEELDGVKISSVQDGSTGRTTVTITSGSPISSVKHFYTSAKLEAGYNFTTEYSSNANATQLVEAAQENPKYENGKFTYSFELTIEEGQYYYIQAMDVAGNVSQYSLEDKVQEDDNTPVTKDDEFGHEVSNIGNTNVGKVILIVLLVILVAAFVLVIVQKIVDYRKKLY